LTKNSVIKNKFRDRFKTFIDEFKSDNLTDNEIVELIHQNINFEQAGLKKYFGEGIFDKIKNVRENPFDINEKRYAVVMFADISGYTALSEKLSAEVVSEIINNCFDMLVDCVVMYNGIIDKFIGDCILCVFGINSGETPEYNACKCALEMQSRFNNLNNELKKLYDFDFKIAIGINSGSLILGNIGCNKRMEYTVIGDTVNTASRIQGTAKGGEILISETVFNKIKKYFITESLNPVKVKNKEEELKLFKIVNFKEEKETVKIPLVGRENELKIIFSELGKVTKRKSRSVLINGDGGIGKSKLVGEFLSSVKSNDGNYLFYTSGSIYQKEFSWKPFKDMFYLFFKLKQNESIKEALTSFGISKSKEFEIPCKYIAQIFNPDEETAQLSINKQMILDAFRIFFRELAKEKKIIFILEDIHHFDSESLEALDYLQRTLKNTNIFFLITKRNEIEWSPKNVKINTINLARLTGKECIILSQNILGSHPEIRLSKYLNENSLGNPYYLLELIQTLKENGLIFKKKNLFYIADDFDKKVEKYSINSISNMILARIDKIGQKEKQIIQIISFFGRNLSFKWLVKLTNFREEDLILERIYDTGLIYREVINNESYISINHQITQEAVYNSILDKKKREIHSKIAALLQEEYKGNENDVYEEIGYHFERSGDEKGSVYYYFMAGIKYLEMFDYNSSLKWTEKSVTLAEKIQSQNEEQAFFSENEIECSKFLNILHFNSYKIKFLLTIESIYYFISVLQSSLMKDIIKISFKIREYSIKYNDKLFLFLSYVNVFSKNIWQGNKFDLTNYEMCLKIAESMEDIFFIGYSKYLSIHLLVKIPNIEYGTKQQLLKRFDESIDIIKSVENDKERIHSFYIDYYTLKADYMRDNLGTESTFKDIINIIDFVDSKIQTDNGKISFYSFISHEILMKTEYREIYLQKALILANNSKDLIQKSYILSSLGYIYLTKGDFKRAFDFHSKSKKICEEIDFRFELGMVHKNLGDLYLTRKNYKKADAEYNKSIKYKKEFPVTLTINDWSNVHIVYTTLAFVYYKMNQIKKTKRLINILRSFFNNNPNFNQKDVIYLSDFIEICLILTETADKKYLIDLKDIYLNNKEEYPNSLYVIFMKNELEELERIYL